jgi:DNA-binding response OmpR family regulator
MPRITGLELIARLKAIRPDCLTVLCTGFADDVSPARASEAGADVFLHKPVEPRDVADRVRALLGRRIAALA